MTDGPAPSLRPDACSAVSVALAEPLAGTATEAPRWLLLEQPGPWGGKAFAESGLERSVGRAILDRCDEVGMRAQLVRRAAPGPARACFVIDTGAATIRRLDLDDPREVLDADLERDGVAIDGPMYAVCTNARRDACCAVHGRAVLRALEGFDVWETSHVGGHRFAANLLCFPHGYLFGRVRATTAATIASGYADGHVDLAHLRGRTCLPGPAQAGEWFVRQEAGFYGVDDVTLESAEGEHVVMLAGGYRWTLRITAVESDPARIESCGADELVRPVRYELAGIETAALR